MTGGREKKREGTVNDFLKNGVKNVYPYLYRFDRIETPITPGIPDISFAFQIPRKRAAEGWIESKSVALPARSTTTILGRDGLSQEQVNFHYFAHRIEGRSFIFVRAGAWKFLVANRFAESVNGWNLNDYSTFATISVIGDWHRHDWECLIQELTR